MATLEEVKNRRRISAELCRLELEKLHEPIAKKVKEGRYNSTNGWHLYREEIEDMKISYLKCENLGEMKPHELDTFLSTLSEEEQSVKAQEEVKTREFENEKAKLGEKLKELTSLYNEFDSTSEAWKHYRTISINSLREKADQLDGVEKDVNTAKVVGTSVAVGGTLGGIAVVAAALSPFTFGASLLVAAGAGTAAVAVGGSAAAIAADQVKKSSEKTSTKMLNEILETDAEKLESLIGYAKQIQKLAEEIQEFCEQLQSERFDQDSGGGVTAAGAAITTITGVAVTGARIADVVLDVGRVASVAAKAFGAVTIVLGGACLILDTITLVKTGKEMAEGSKNQVAKQFREKAPQLEEELTKIAKELPGVEVAVQKSIVELHRKLKGLSLP